MDKKEIGFKVRVSIQVHKLSGLLEEQRMAFASVDINLTNFGL